MFVRVLPVADVEATSSSTELFYQGISIGSVRSFHENGVGDRGLKYCKLPFEIR
jgi:hypothetical protein